MVRYSPKAQGAYKIVNNVRICAKLKYNYKAKQINLETNMS